MNTKRCELCGTLYPGWGNSVSVAIKYPEKKHEAFTHYNTCLSCASKVYNTTEELKTSDTSSINELEVKDRLIVEQNHEINFLRRCISQALCSLSNAQKRPHNDVDRWVDDAFEHLTRAEVKEYE